MDGKKEIFTYICSASQQEEIKRIREKYAPPTEAEDKMERLRRLDQGVTRPGTILSILIGGISTLIFGLGMCCTIVWAETLFIPGIVIGVIGMLGIILAYPVYTYITKKQREKAAPEILRLTDEPMK